MDGFDVNVNVIPLSKYHSHCGCIQGGGASLKSHPKVILKGNLSTKEKQNFISITFNK